MVDKNISELNIFSYVCKYSICISDPKLLCTCTISIAVNIVRLKIDRVYLLLFHHTFSYPFHILSFHILFTRIHQLCTELGGVPFKKKGDIFLGTNEEEVSCHENPVKLGQLLFCLYLSFYSPVFVIVPHLARIWPK